MSPWAPSPPRLDLDKFPEEIILMIARILAEEDGVALKELSMSQRFKGCFINLDLTRHQLTHTSEAEVREAFSHIKDDMDNATILRLGDHERTINPQEMIRCSMFTEKMLRDLIPRLGGLRYIDLTSCLKRHDKRRGKRHKILNLIAESCRQVQVVNISQMASLSDKIFEENKLDSSGIVQIIRNCSSLKELRMLGDWDLSKELCKEFRCAPSLQTLALGSLLLKKEQIRFCFEDANHRDHFPRLEMLHIRAMIDDTWTRHTIDCAAVGLKRLYLQDTWCQDIWANTENFSKSHPGIQLRVTRKRGDD